MPRYENEKLGCSFTLPDDLTHRQVEQYEATVQAILKDQEVTDALLARSAVAGILATGAFTEMKGLPAKAEEIENCTFRRTWWMAERVARYMVDLKALDPNS